MTILYLTLGVVALIGAGVLLRWAAPKAGQESRLTGWMATTIPMLVLIFGVAGITLLAKGFFG